MESAPNASLENPFTVYRTALYTAFYQNPSTGFKARMIVLFTLNGLVILLGLVYLVILSTDSRRKNRRGGLWLFRLVQRPSGRYIATNQNLWSALMSLVSGGVILGHLQDGYLVYLKHAPQDRTSCWRSLSFIPLFVHGWIVSWAIFQAFLLTPDQHDHHLFSAVVANTCFVGGGAILLIGMAVSAAIASVLGDNLWISAVKLLNELTILEPTWTGGPISASAASQLAPLQATLRSESHKYKRSLTVQTAFLVTVPLLTAIINLASIGLARVLRKQIKYNFGQFRRASAALTENETMEASVGSESSTVTTSVTKKEHRPSRAEIRQLARTSESGIEGEQAKHIMILQKAERDLLLISTFLLAVLLGSSSLILWIVIELGRGKSLGGWVSTEVALFGMEWIYSITASLTLVLLIHNAYSHLQAPIIRDFEECEAGKNPTELMTLRGMFASGPKTGSPHDSQHRSTSHYLTEGTFDSGPLHQLDSKTGASPSSIQTDWRGPKDLESV